MCCMTSQCFNFTFVIEVLPYYLYSKSFFLKSFFQYHQFHCYSGQTCYSLISSFRISFQKFPLSFYHLLTYFVARLYCSCVQCYCYGCVLYFHSFIFQIILMNVGFKSVNYLVGSSDSQELIFINFLSNCYDSQCFSQFPFFFDFYSQNHDDFLAQMTSVYFSTLNFFLFFFYHTDLMINFIITELDRTH